MPLAFGMTCHAVPVTRTLPTLASMRAACPYTKPPCFTDVAVMASVTPTLRGRWRPSLACGVSSRWCHWWEVLKRTFCFWQQQKLQLHSHPELSQAWGSVLLHPRCGGLSLMKVLYNSPLTICSFEGLRCSSRKGGKSHSVSLGQAYDPPGSHRLSLFWAAQIEMGRPILSLRESSGKVVRAAIFCL